MADLRSDYERLDRPSRHPDSDADDVPRIVALLNAAFAMERDFIDNDRTSTPEIERYMTTGTFFVVDGEAGGARLVHVSRAARRSDVPRHAGRQRRDSRDAVSGAG